MSEFTIDGFAAMCKSAMAATDDRQSAARRCLQQVLDDYDTQHVLDVLDAAIPPGADIGEMIVHTSPELTMLFGRVPARFQSGIHNHTVFACIGQLTGHEKNVFYERDLDHGLEVVGETTAAAGELIAMPADAIHCIENPDHETSRALHIYGGDFKAVMDQRSLWTSVAYEERPFSFELLMQESARAMRRDGNTAGLAALVEAVPAMRAFVESGDA